MIDENEAAQAEGEAMPASNAFHRFEDKAEAVVDRVVAAVEAWYAKHFHSGVANGTPVISADDKAALIAHVSAAVSTTKE